jgi:hypothetical protein
MTFQKTNQSAKNIDFVILSQNIGFEQSGKFWPKTTGGSFGP